MPKDILLLINAITQLVTAIIVPYWLGCVINVFIKDTELVTNNRLFIWARGGTLLILFILFTIFIYNFNT